jgi:hypothetical protein
MTRNWHIFFSIQVIVIFLSGQAIASDAQHSRGEQGFSANKKSFGQKGRAVSHNRGKAAGKAIKVHGALAVDAGYDPNPEGLVENIQGSAFERLSGALLTDFGTARDGLTILAHGSVANFNSLVDNHRYDANVLADYHKDIMKGVRLNLGGYYVKDTYGYSIQENMAGFYELVESVKTRDAFLKGHFFSKEYTRDGEAGDSPFGHSSAFNHQTYRQQGGILLWKDQRFSPYLEGGLASIDYTRQANETVLDRDALDMHGVGGIRVRLNEKVYVDLGVRANLRNTEDRIVNRFTSVGFDGKLVWSVSEGVYLSLETTHDIVEPSSEMARLGDRYLQVIGLEIDPPESPWAFELYGSHEYTRQIGDSATFSSYFVQAGITYDLNKRAQLFADTLYENFDDVKSDDSYSRIRVNAGMKVRF